MFMVTDLGLLDASKEASPTATADAGTGRQHYAGVALYILFRNKQYF